VWLERWSKKLFNQMSSAEKISSAKLQLRKSAKAVRKQAAATYGATATQSLAQLGIAFAGVSSPAIVSGYQPIGDEADISKLMTGLDQQGYQIALPVIVGKGQPLEFRTWSPGDTLDEVQWGIQEPGDDAEIVVPDVLLCPLLAFDEAGYRLGYGGGFYDRSLAQIRAQKPVVTIGIAFDEQKVDVVPRDAYDQRLDWILTPSGAHKFA